MTDVNQIFVHFSAPTLCGIKPGNLFSLKAKDCSEGDIAHWKLVFLRQGIFLKKIRVSDEQVLFFVYDFRRLKRLLGERPVRAVLEEKGYPVQKGFRHVLNELFFRLEKSDGFPHEVGIFLGYPLDDVVAFELQEGRNCKYCGYWKAYSNVDEAKAVCCSYSTCSRLCKKWFEEGYSIPRIIKEYKKAAETAA